MPHGGQTHEAVADLHKALLSAELRLDGFSRATTEPIFNSSPAAAALKAPGAFRRNYLHTQADAEGRPMVARPEQWRRPLVEMIKTIPDMRVGNYVAIFGGLIDDDGQELPLPPGESGTVQTILALTKSFVGSGITFLPGAFLQGGLGFSSAVLVVIAFGNLACIRLLLSCSTKIGCAGFGEIAEKAAGPWAKQAVHVSLVVSQFGTLVAYFIFMGQMAESLGILNYVVKSQCIAGIVILIVPLCFIRSIHRLEAAILAADVFIVFGLGVAVWYSASHLLENGPAENLTAFSPETCGIFIGTAVFTFEGIPFILPIKSSMKEPDKFWPLFVKTFVCIVVFFVLFGASGYADYGANVHAVVLLNMPKESALATSVRAAYMVALMFGSPLCFLPGARITELWIFGVLQEKGSKKWRKNALRTLEMCLLGVVSVYGGEFFAKFLAFVGGLCCAPIAFIYPAYFHFRLCAETLTEKVVDWFFILSGTAAMVFVVYQAATS